ncbi:hypothetical protein [Halalkalibacter alkaliphilus]|uniref:Uncharacterized protein n=1 Tax=Halalkalibacter alkaliphilus TaxID=2917993 RepID=A0A9X2CTM6_9BACI|nr:hypothetical protein [Halalkalibacter alkaliphilus]MCL7747935.1 hypothetical protein [Halalkalibacter alkaliphilus]
MIVLVIGLNLSVKGYEDVQRAKIDVFSYQQPFTGFQKNETLGHIRSFKELSIPHAAALKTFDGLMSSRSNSMMDW